MPANGTPEPRRVARGRHWARALAGMAVLAVAIAACGGSPASTTSSAAGAGGGDGTLTIASGGAPSSLNPTLAALSVPVEWYSNLAYEPLIVQQANGKQSPGLALTWGYVGTGNVAFQLTLRPGVRFSDGSALTAAAVKASFEYYLAHSVEPEPLGPGVVVSATGPLTVKITLKVPDPELVGQLSQNSEMAWVISPTGLKNPSVLGNSTHGAGPYMLDAADTIANSKYVYVPNPYYFDKSAVHWKKIVINVITNPSSALAALATGQAQVMQGQYQLVGAAKADGLSITTVPATNGPVVMQAHISSANSPLASQSVRQALAYAIDRTAIQKAFYGSYATDDQELEGPGDTGYVAALAQRYTYDPAKAKSLLAAAGYPHGFTVTANCSPQLNMADLCEAVKSYWAKIGVNLQVSAPIESVWVSQLLSGKFDFTGIGDYESSAYNQTKGSYLPGLETGSYQIPGLAALFQAASGAPVGSDQATAAWAHIQQVEMDAATAIEVASPNQIIFSKNISGISFSPANPVPDPVDWQAG